MNITVDYFECSEYTEVTTMRNRQPITRAVTDKATGVTTVEVFKEGSTKPIETYVYNKDLTKIVK